MKSTEMIFNWHCCRTMMLPAWSDSRNIMKSTMLEKKPFSPTQNMGRPHGKEGCKIHRQWQRGIPQVAIHVILWDNNTTQCLSTLGCLERPPVTQYNETAVRPASEKKSARAFDPWTWRSYCRKNQHPNVSENCQ